MKKKVVVLMLCTMMAVTALGCGGKKNDTAEGTEAARKQQKEQKQWNMRVLLMIWILPIM